MRSMALASSESCFLGNLCNLLQLWPTFILLLVIIILFEGPLGANIDTPPGSPTPTHFNLLHSFSYAQRDITPSDFQNPQQQQIYQNMQAHPPANSTLAPAPLLTKNAVARLRQTPIDSQVQLPSSPLLVEVKNIKSTHSLVSFDIWDSSGKIRGFVNGETNPDCNPLKYGQQIQQGKYLLNIKEFICTAINGTKLIQILKIDKIDEKVMIEIQKQTKKEGDVNPGQKGQNSHSNQNTGGTLFESDSNSNDKKPVMAEPDLPLSPPSSYRPEVIPSEALKNFQKISDLYVDFQHWQILVRIIDFSYKQFKSKQGKLIKLLTLELIDRTGIKIQATLFGDQALEEKQRIKKGHVYRIAKGQIKEHFYSQTLGEGCSKLNIILFKDSQIVEVQDMPEIPSTQESTLALSQVLSDSNYQRYYDILVILLQIGQEKQIEKEGGKKVTKRHFVVGDPQSHKCIECIIWTKNLAVDESWLLRPIALKSFRLNSYKDQLSLCSVFRSEVQLRPNSKLSIYEKVLHNMEFTDVNSKSIVIKPVSTPQVKTTESRTIIELQNEIGYLPANGTLSSELQVWITFIKLQGKWLYGACNNPRCKKAAQAFNKCSHCGSYNSQINQKYMIPIELSDYTGSIWTTAFDDFGNDIFRNHPRSQLQQMNQNQLKDFAQIHLYQQYKVRLTTKRQGEFVIRHSIAGKPSELSVETSMKANLAKIKAAVELDQ